MDLTSHGIVALIKSDEKYLLVKDSREQMLDYWAPPHGRCESEDASEEAAVIREVREETHLDVEPLKKVATLPADTKIKTVSFWLVKSDPAQEVVLDKSESSSYGWFTLEEALGLKLYPGTKQFFEGVLNRKFSLE